MHKILLSVMTIGLVTVFMGAGVYALFSDTETAAGNTFTAGTLNLKVGAADPCTETINIGSLKPTDAANAASWLVHNLGTMSGSLDITIGAITNNENTITEPEAAAGDVTTPAGELGGLLKTAFWMDSDKGGTWTSGDYYLKSDGTKVAWQTGESTLPTAAYDLLNNYPHTWTSVQTVATNADAGNFRVEYNFPNGGATDNVAQGDSCVFDITFTLNQ
jgi:predicted ribosomally synthesized peptide with SipW-like signal peptide